MDNVNELIELVKELQKKVDTLANSVATLDTKVQKLNYLQKLLDVEIDTLTFGDILQYSNDGKWHNIQPSKIFVSQSGGSSGASKLTDLSDVVVSNPSNGQVLTYNSLDRKWYNNTISSGGGGGDLSNYLTRAEAAAIYYPITGGAITGNVRIEGDLLVTGGITLYGE